MPIYTKKGDKGTSTVISTPKGERILKSSLIFETLGAFDELNSFIGIVIASTEDKELIEKLIKIQNNLFVINSCLAGARVKLPNLETKEMERDIDEMTDKMPKLSNFVLPGGTGVSAKLHYCRTLARKAERRLVGLSAEQKIGMSMFRYVNRLSDYFFTLARYQNYLHSVPDKAWRNTK